MTLGEENEGWTPSLIDLPDDVLYAVLSFCDLRTLGRLSCVCLRLTRLIEQDCIWLWRRRRLTVVQDYRKAYSGSLVRTPLKEQCRIALNWKRDIRRDIRLIHHRTRQLPWLQLSESNLWISYKNCIKCYHQKKDGFLRPVSHKTLRGHDGDVGRFVCKDNIIVSGSRDGSICCYSALSGYQLVWLPGCHRSDIHAVDFHGDVIVSGSRDASIKLWSMTSAENGSLLYILPAEDRVWSVATNPAGGSFTCGTAGINNVPPLRIWDMQRMQLLGSLGSQYRNGAGVLDIQYESPDVILSCGYDTYIRMWDVRTSLNYCVKQWEEPFDSTIYCIKSDHNNSILAGTARYGMVRLWDKRMLKHVQFYYVGKSSSPVYSMAFDSSRLYVALDKGINMLDFGFRG